jgi:Zn-finger nucleic acid-binding protein
MVPGSSFECQCGETIEATPPEGVDAPVQRCSACGAVAREGDEVCDYCGSARFQTPTRGSLICPECMARNLEDARFCLACGVRFAPQTVMPMTKERRCPCCDRWLEGREVAALIVEECPKCQGLWAPGDVFAELVDRAAATARSRGTGSPPGATPRVDGGNPAKNRVEYRRCPDCDEMMARRNFRKRSGVIVDQCHAHGTWLDAHELEEIAGFVLSGGAESAQRIEAALRDRSASRQPNARRSLLTSMIQTDDRGVFGSGDAAGSILGLFSSLLE